MPATAGISGGRTSAMMAYRIPSESQLVFCNTGREAAGTYEFLARLEADLQRPIVRLEFRAPPSGEPPKMATFEIVPHERLSRTWADSPFRAMLECLRSYRAKHKQLGPIAPWARQRICTAHLKIKTHRRYCASLGWGTARDFTEYIGLRFDEPGRVARMRERNDSLDTDERAPLFDSGVTKPDVMRFWASKPFDLGIDDWLGNCTACFLKDEADLATALLEPETEADSWIAIEDRFGPMRRGRPSYRQVFEEAQARMVIREAIAAGRAYTVDLPARRVKLIVAQEIERFKNGSAPFSCECDAAKADDFGDDDFG